MKFNINGGSVVVSMEPKGVHPLLFHDLRQEIELLKSKYIGYPITTATQEWLQRDLTSLRLIYATYQPDYHVMARYLNTFLNKLEIKV